MLALHSQFSLEEVMFLLLASVFVGFLSLSFWNAITRNSLVSAKLGSLCEILPAFIAHKRFLAGVCSHVIVQSGRPCKSAGTVAALKWLLTGVTDRMSTKLSWAREA